ncbi:MAG TPA: hypothetical protein VID50_10510 [Candidatus Eisenbacteria bacterium]
MRGLRLLSLLAIALAARVAHASCGCEFCPIDQGSQWHEATFTFDLTQQYIDQDQPRVGTEDVGVGAIASHHDEVRMVNRATTASVGYHPGDAWAVSASLPYVSRTHEHIDNESGTPEYMRWSYSGLGDLEVLATHYILPARGGARYFARLGAKAPTGRRNVEEVNGEQPEPVSRPGTGSWDLLGGLGAEWHVTAPGGERRVPVRLNLSGRLNGKGTDDYRAGSEFQAHLGTEYAVAGPVAALLQTNLRVRGKDDIGSTDEDSGNTGGTSWYLSPGARLAIASQTSVYGLYQIPLYQRVNGIQLTAAANLYVGISRGLR